ncbi:MAG TPA: hypothetical protein VF599_05985 [Pyrinomonadaceae bacterium]
MTTENVLNAERKRLEQARLREKDWKRWGCYVSERAWGTVREDYSADGAAWDYFPFETAASRAFRWNEDGIAGICDRKQGICFAVAVWNERDPILKERLYGVGGNVGNHGEDVKEYYFYLDSTPTHSYMKFLYKYPHAEFPYEQLKNENFRRDKSQPEFELMDTGIFEADKYTDVFIEYAKADDEDICIKITAVNRSDEAAPLHVLPTVWFRNVWSWSPDVAKPHLEKEEIEKTENLAIVKLEHNELGARRLYCAGAPKLLFTENETNNKKLFGAPNLSEYVKDGIGDFVVNQKNDAVNPNQTGTKAAAHYVFNLAPASSETIYLRFTNRELKSGETFVEDCAEIFQRRIVEADEFYAEIIPDNLSGDAKNVMRQSFAGMLWSKQFYHYVVKDWLEGDAKQPAPPEQRESGRNSKWTHLYNADVVSMPDKWEYPWYAAWDLAFHCIPLAIIDADFAKRQLILMLREWYMHPNGQIPAYEWKFEDVNPPVHAWAALRVYKIEARRRGGEADRAFLEKIFHKLLLNFTWWVNRKDFEGNNVFEGGFLGLDNIGIFDRSAPLPLGAQVEQSDGTSWMAMFSLNMLAIALELAKEDKVYEDVASKFFEHFVYIADAMNNIGEEQTELWNERDGFYYDVLHMDGKQMPLKLRSMVGLIPLFAVETVEEAWLDELPDFKRRMDWFLQHRPDLTDSIECAQLPGRENRRILALVNRERLQRVLRVMLSENEFLSDYGIRAVSRWHKANPYTLRLDDREYRLDYEPAESRSGTFGGNSNWRGPVWFPVNYLLIEALQKFDFYYGDEFKVEFPTGSGRMLTLWQVSQELEKRLTQIFLKDSEGRRAVYGKIEKFQSNENWRDYILFYEYFHGDNGLGLGASHQTGWTGLIGKILQQIGEYS